ncbi:MAG: YceI family protein [Nitrospirota bacterium]|jgi:polyisoprenoid-binding protein YceI
MARWIIDPDHTVAAFAVRHFMVTDVHGQFNGINGTINFDPPDLTSLSAEVTIGSSVMTTGIPKRDGHLKSPDFLDVEKFPEIRFRSGGVELTGLNGCKLNGTLAIRGIERPVVLDVECLGPIKSPWGETTLGFKASTSINREDFGMTWNEKMEKGGFVVGREVRITLDAEADLAEEG